jgi:stage V sporulation protein G
MEVTEVRVRVVRDENAEKLRAFGTITLDNEFVVRDLKVIEGNSGLFVAMPSRKIMTRCQSCGAKCPSRSAYCGDCGKRLPEEDDAAVQDGRVKTHADIAHPISQDCRDKIHQAVIRAYRDANERGTGSTTWKRGAKRAASPLDEDVSGSTDRRELSHSSGRHPA